MKTAILLSGGVDSSVALKLLQANPAYEITAFYLKIWLEEELTFLGNCPWQEDLQYVREICGHYNIPLQVIPFQHVYQKTIVNHVLQELISGRTPSPDILCNQMIKFGEFFRIIDDQFKHIATGHYAQIEKQCTRFFLKRSPDPVKDQSYFLSRLSQQQLSRALFPIGHLTKDVVRKIAADSGLPNQSRKDSQGICFLGKIRYHDFIKFHLGTKPGDIIDITTKKRLGEHEGYWFYTIGQRHGLKLGGGPWYVVRKDSINNSIYVSHQNCLQQLASDELIVRDVHWITSVPDTFNLHVKLRHGPKLIACQIEPHSDDQWLVSLHEKDSGIAPGQYAIFYDGIYCLGSGIIM